MTEDRTPALANAITRLREDGALWRGDAWRIAFDKLEGINHGFENPAKYEFEMSLAPGERAPGALALATRLGMTTPTLVADADWPSLARLADPAWEARCPDTAVEVCVKVPARPPLELVSSHDVWGPIRIERRDVPFSHDRDAHDALLAILDRVSATWTRSPGAREPFAGEMPTWTELIDVEGDIPIVRVRRRWVALNAFRDTLKSRGASHVGSRQSVGLHYYACGPYVLAVRGEPHGEDDYVRSLGFALP